MIALTQEKREELAQFAKATLNSLNGIEPEDPNQYDDCLSEYTQKCMEIALASLTAEPVLYAVDSDVEDKIYTALCNEHEDGSYPLFTAPPVPEIRTDQYLGLQVSIDVSTCDKDSGNRYFGRVTSLSEGEGEIVLLVEDSEKNFDTTIPLPPFDGYNEDVVRELQAAFIQAITKVGIKIKE